MGLWGLTQLVLAFLARDTAPTPRNHCSASIMGSGASSTASRGGVVELEVVRAPPQDREEMESEPEDKEELEYFPSHEIVRLRR